MLSKQTLFGKREDALAPAVSSNSSGNSTATGLPASQTGTATSTPSTPATPPRSGTGIGTANGKIGAESGSSSAAGLPPATTGSEEVVAKNRLIVGPDVKLKGAEILDCDTLVVEGRVEASMDSRALQISEHGSFNGKVSIDIAEIRGVFEGDLTARSLLVIHACGRVSGKIRYGKLSVEQGGELSGDIQALSARDAPAASGSTRPQLTEAPKVIRSGESVST